MSVLTKSLPPIPFGDAPDCVLLYCPLVDSYRVIVGTAQNGKAHLSAVYASGHSDYSSDGCRLCFPAGAVSYMLTNGEWIEEPQSYTTSFIFVNEKDMDGTVSMGGVPISATFDLYLDTHLTPYADWGDTVLLDYSYIDLHHDPVVLIDSVLSGEKLTTPILKEFYGLLPVLLAVLVSFLAIRKGISFVECHLRGA